MSVHSVADACGAAFFSAMDGRLCEVWVLGDVDHRDGSSRR